MKPIRQNVKFDKKLLDKDAHRIIQILNKSSFEAYLVGGCVRDLLLGLKPKDFDIVTDATPEQIHQLFKRSRIIGRRFRLVHVMFSNRKFLEVATFRAGQVKTAKNGVIIRDNRYGTMQEDVFRRDFGINALYYDVIHHQVIDYVSGLEDIKQRMIQMIGDPNVRFEQDPVRMIRAVRFKVKLNAKLSDEVEQAIHQNAALMKNVSSARLYEECIKLFHNDSSVEVFQQLEHFGLLKYLFANTQRTEFIDKALDNTSKRIRQGKSVTPAFIFAVFLWQDQNKRFEKIKQKRKSSYEAMSEACELSIKQQIRQTSLPKWLTKRVKEVWLMQSKLERKQTKKVKQILANPRFRMAYDFLLLRSKSINPELKKVAKFWTEAQK